MYEVEPSFDSADIVPQAVHPGLQAGIRFGEGRNVAADRRLSDSDRRQTLLDLAEVFPDLLHGGIEPPEVHQSQVFGLLGQSTPPPLRSVQA